jgi:hypothetical protein
MSRIGRLPVAIPSGVDVTIDGRSVKVKGPKGELSHVVAEPITVEKGEDGIQVGRPDDERTSRALHGLTRSLINNMVLGVTEGYEKKMEIYGTGYRVALKGTDHRGRPSGRLLRGRDSDPLLGAGHRQAGGRRGRREHPQASQARPLQGQGRPLRGRADPPQGRKGW